MKTSGNQLFFLFLFKHCKSTYSLKTNRANAILGLGIIIQTPDISSQKIFYRQNLVVEDIFNQMLYSVRQVN